MNFSEALSAVRAGAVAARAAWNGRGVIQWRTGFTTPGQSERTPSVHLVFIGGGCSDELARIGVQERAPVWEAWWSVENRDVCADDWFVAELPK